MEFMTISGLLFHLFLNNYTRKIQNIPAIVSIGGFYLKIKNIYMVKEITLNVKG